MCTSFLNSLLKLKTVPLANSNNPQTIDELNSNSGISSPQGATRNHYMESQPLFITTLMSLLTAHAAFIGDHTLICILIRWPLEQTLIRKTIRSIHTYKHRPLSVPLHYCNFSFRNFLESRIRMLCVMPCILYPDIVCFPTRSRLAARGLYHDGWTNSEYSWQNQTSPIQLYWYHDADHQLSLSSQALILSLWSTCTWMCDITGQQPITSLD